MMLPWTTYYGGRNEYVDCDDVSPSPLQASFPCSQLSRSQGMRRIKGVLYQTTRQHPAALGMHSLTQSPSSHCHPNHDENIPHPTQSWPLDPGITLLLGRTDSWTHHFFFFFFPIWKGYYWLSSRQSIKSCWGKLLSKLGGRWGA